MLLSPRCFFVFARYLSAYRQRVSLGAGWSSPVARQAHNLKVVSSNLAPATNKPLKSLVDFEGFPFGAHKFGTITLLQLEYA